jgi:hypothetical protein
MSEQEKIASGGNIAIPTIVQLQRRSFVVTHRDAGNGYLEWRAERPDMVVHADSALELFGLVALREERGPRPWHRQDDDDWDAATEAFWSNGSVS